MGNQGPEADRRWELLESRALHWDERKELRLTGRQGLGDSKDKGFTLTKDIQDAVDSQGLANSLEDKSLAM